MNPLRLFVWLLLAGVVCGPVQGQFYAPETERHDPVQRFFPVEMARILGWFENEKFPGISEIRYEVATKGDGATAWQIRWVNGEGKAVFQTTVEYPAVLLESGPEFYRNVALQISRPNFQQRFQGIRGAEAIEHFWKGAALLDVSRERTFSNILSLEMSFDEDSGGTIAKLAGALTHSALFNVADRLSIDSVTAARGAAWLALAERISAGKADELWGPTLFLGGRENQAANLWQKTHAANLANATAAERGLECLDAERGSEGSLPICAWEGPDGDGFADARVRFAGESQWRTLGGYSSASVPGP